MRADGDNIRQTLRSGHRVYHSSGLCNATRINSGGCPAAQACAQPLMSSILARCVASAYVRACVLGVDLPHAASGPGSGSPATDTIRWWRDHVHLEGTIGLMIEISCRGLFRGKRPVIKIQPALPPRTQCPLSGVCANTG